MMNISIEKPSGLLIFTFQLLYRTVLMINVKRLLDPKLTLRYLDDYIILLKIQFHLPLLFNPFMNLLVNSLMKSLLIFDDQCQKDSWIFN